MKFTVNIRARGVDYARFREIYFSESFNREIVRAVGLQKRATTEHHIARDGKERMRVRVVPRLALPAVIGNLVAGHVVSYDEVTVFDPATRQAALSIETAAGEIVQVRGRAALLEGPGGVELRFAGEANVHFLGLGRLIERFLVGEVTRRYRLVEQALQRHIDDPATARRPGGVDTLVNCSEAATGAGATSGV